MRLRISNRTARWLRILSGPLPITLLRGKTRALAICKRRIRSVQRCDLCQSPNPAKASVVIRPQPDWRMFDFYFDRLPYGKAASAECVYWSESASGQFDYFTAPAVF